MALLVTKTLPTGQTTQGYLRISRFEIVKTQELQEDNTIKEKFLIALFLDFWSNKDVYLSSLITGYVPLESNNYVVFEGDKTQDIYAQSYAYLKKFQDGILGVVWSGARDEF